MKKPRIGVRGHDMPAENVDSLCSQLCALGVDEIQLVVHKSFPQFIYNRKHIETLAEAFQRSGIRIAVYGCYIDPLSDEGQARFHEHIRYAQLLNAGGYDFVTLGNHDFDYGKAGIEAYLAALDARLEEAASDYEKYSALYAEKEAQEQKLTELMERWEALAAEAGE